MDPQHSDSPGSYARDSPDPPVLFSTALTPLQSDLRRRVIPLRRALASQQSGMDPSTFRSKLPNRCTPAPAGAAAILTIRLQQKRTGRGVDTKSGEGSSATDVLPVLRIASYRTTLPLHEKRRSAESAGSHELEKNQTEKDALKRFRTLPNAWLAL